MSSEWQAAHFWGGVSLPAPGQVIDEFVNGFEEGRRTVEAETASERAALLQLASALEALETPAPALLAAMMVTAVERLVIDIAGKVALDREILASRAEMIAQHIANEVEPVLVLHPEDATMIEAERLMLAIHEDATVARGTVRGRFRGGVMEDGVGPALTRLRAELDRMGLAA